MTSFENISINVSVDQHKDFLKQIEDIMLAKIPLLKSMKAKVFQSEDGEFSMKAPLGPNQNHVMSAFGGSIAALATAAGWGVIVGELKKGNISASVVVVKSSIKYIQPIMSDFIASCKTEPIVRWTKFKDKLKTTSHSKIKICVNVVCNHEVCAILEGTFLARMTNA
ncbi:MAG: hypothetical protein COA79_02500 [Planctomycetota bacterium]|nr:MAG: hypothetical protein COA79_02500 [Planctomycetota bacterium]